MGSDRLNNTKRWKLTRQLFAVALEKPAGERDAYLAEACAGDRELRKVVDRLLADATDGGESWLDDGAAQGVVRQAFQGQSFEGQVIGDFVIRGILGSGGMATVFEAEQQHPKRTVALKVTRLGLLSDSARRRFEYESEVLAGLRHPGIAQVYGAGTYDDPLSGQELPYFAMELIEGARTLNGYVEEEQCDLVVVLRLFLKICHAVHYGHQRGFIHRDLKPQNVLVDDRGRPKIIDFGIARATEAEAGGQTLLTQHGEILGTLHYMSPEQVEPDEQGLDIRCDVYALGVILFELLAARLPLELDGMPITAAVSVIKHTEPPLPSSFGSRFSESRQSEDLDWVVLKAMDKDRDRRYASAAELAADLEHVLADEPILARPRSRLYLARKFIRRHRVAVSAAAVVVVSLIVGITMTSIGLGRARAAEQKATKAEREATTAEGEAKENLEAARLEAGMHKAVNKFLAEILTAADPLVHGRDVKVIDLLDRASDKAEELYGDRPELAAAVGKMLGTTFLDLDQPAEARSHLERAVELAREHLDADSDVTLHAILNLGLCYLELRMMDEAEALLTESVHSFKEAYGHRSRDAARAIIALAKLANERNEIDAAVAGYTEAREILAALPEPNSVIYVSTSSSLGWTLHLLGRNSEAEEILRTAAARGDRELGAEHPNVLNVRNNLATVLSNQGKLEEALELIQAAVEVHDRVMGRHASVTLTALNSLAATLTRMGDYSQAETQFRELLERRKQAGQYAHVKTAIALNNLGSCLLCLHQLEEAETAVEEALEMLQQTGVPAAHYFHPVMRKGLADIYIRQARFAAGETLLKDCLVDFDNAQGDQRLRIRQTLASLVRLYDAWEKPELAAKVRRRLARR